MGSIVGATDPKSGSTQGLRTGPGNINFEQAVPAGGPTTMFDHGLPKDWVVRPALDLELKRYILLAYLQRVEQRFRDRKLYPHLEELGAHVEELEALREGQATLARAWPGDVVGFDHTTGAVVRERQPEDPALQVVTAVVDLALQGMKRLRDEGQGLREELAGTIRLEPVGVEPLVPHEGWLLLRTGQEARVYRYTLPWVRPGKPLPPHRLLRTRYVMTTTVGLARPYERIKADLRALWADVPNPATYVFEAEPTMPCIETFMPLAKQLVYERIGRAA
jgi:hypothetical protein